MSVYFNAKKLLEQYEMYSTPKRIEVLNYFVKNRLGAKPVDAQFLIDYFRYDKVTVFRMLNLFAEKGIIRKLEFGEGKARYELATKDDHHHLICESCGKIEDITDTVLPSVERKIVKQTGFLIKRHSLEFFGLCKNCQV